MRGCRLPYEHRHSALSLCPVRLSALYKSGFKRIVDRVKHSGASAYGAVVNGLFAVVGVHSDGRGIDKHVYGADYLVYQPEAHLSIRQLARDVETEQSCLADVLSADGKLKGLAHKGYLISHCARHAAAA